MMARNPEKTRKRLLQAAFEEMHARGFQGMRVDEVLRKSKLQKGAFYHHFSSKLELGYAVLEEEISPLLDKIWLEPLKNIQNPVEEFPRLLKNLADRVPKSFKEHGCPLNNIAQEMAYQDKGFQERVSKQFNHWIDAYTQLFEQAQVKNQLRSDVEAAEVARFFVATLEGCISLSKAEQSAVQWQACRSQLGIYLRGLIPE